MRLACHTPIRRRAKLHERFPYGLKNERLRARVVRAMLAEGSSAAGAEFVPLSGLHQAYRLSGSVRRNIGQVTAPSLVLHAIDDDVASTRNAEFVARNIRSSEVRTVLYRESYHILTMDNDKDAVADETIGFFRRHGAAAVNPLTIPQRNSESQLSLSVDESETGPNTWMPGIMVGPANDATRADELDRVAAHSVAEA
jgi:hypothetical protein